MTRADAVRELATALRNETSVRRAFAQWLRRYPSAPQPLLGDDALGLMTLLEVADRTGCPAAPTIEALAVAIDQRARDRAAGDAAATTARSSARAMVLMPVLAAPLLLLADVPLGDAAGVGSALVAAALMYAGWLWIERLVPDPPPDDEATRFCELLSCAVAGGLGPSAACAAIAPAFPRVTAEAARLVRMGLTWSEALARGSGMPGRAGSLLQRMERSGVAVASELAALADGRRRERRIAFDIALKAAPVRMIWPLVACALPAFCSLTVLPMVRGIASSL